MMGLERRGCVVRPWPLANWKREEPVGEAKPFNATAEHREPCDSRASCTFWERPEVKFLRATRHGRPTAASARLLSLTRTRANDAPVWIEPWEEPFSVGRRIGEPGC